MLVVYGYLNSAVLAAYRVAVPATALALIAPLYRFFVLGNRLPAFGLPATILQLADVLFATDVAPRIPVETG